MEILGNYKMPKEKGNNKESYKNISYLGSEEKCFWNIRYLSYCSWKFFLIYILIVELLCILFYFVVKHYETCFTVEEMLEIK